MVNYRHHACQPVNRLLSQDGEPPRPLPGVRQHPLLAWPTRSDRNLELGRRPVCLGRGKHLQGGAAARQAGVRARDRGARDDPSLFDARRAARRRRPRTLEPERLLAASPARTTLRRERNGFSLISTCASARPRSASLAPVLWSAGDLLTGAARQSASAPIPNAAGLFLDDSRAGKRRWCSMSPAATAPRRGGHYHKTRAKKKKGKDL